MNSEIRAKILEADDLPIEEVRTPEWGQVGIPVVWIRTMSGTERDAFEEEILLGEPGEKRQLDPRNIRARFAVKVICDKDGQRIFGDEDADLLGAKSSCALDRVFHKAQKLNGLRAEDVETLAKKSGQTLGDDSG